MIGTARVLQRCRLHGTKRQTNETNKLKWSKSHKLRWQSNETKCAHQIHIFEFRFAFWLTIVQYYAHSQYHSCISFTLHFFFMASDCVFHPISSYFDLLLDSDDVCYFLSILWCVRECRLAFFFSFLFSRLIFVSQFCSQARHNMQQRVVFFGNDLQHLLYIYFECNEQTVAQR